MRKRFCWLLAVMMMLALSGAALAEVGALTVSAKFEKTLRVWRGEGAGFEPNREMSVTIAATAIQNALTTTIPAATEIGNRSTAAQLVFEYSLLKSAGNLTFNFSGDNINLAAVYQKDDENVWTQLETSGNSLIFPDSTLHPALPHNGSYKLAFRTENNYFVVDLGIRDMGMGPISGKGRFVASNFTLSVDTNEVVNPHGRPCELYGVGSDLRVYEIERIVFRNLDGGLWREDGLWRLVSEDTGLTVSLGHTAYPNVKDKLNGALKFTATFESDLNFTAAPIRIFLPVGGMNAMDDAYNSSEGILEVESADAQYDATSKKLTFTLNPANKYFDVDGDTYLLVCAMSSDVSPVSPTNPDNGGNSNNNDAPTSDKTVPTMPTSNFTTSADIVQNMSLTPTSGWPSITINITLPDGTKPQAGTVFYIWINIITPLSATANVASVNTEPYVLESGEDGKLDLDVSKLKDTNGNAVNFPGGICTVTYQSKDGKFSGKTDEVKLASTSQTTTGGSGGGGCDAGFGALAMAALGTALLRLRRK